MRGRSLVATWLFLAGVSACAARDEPAPPAPAPTCNPVDMGPGQLCVDVDPGEPPGDVYVDGVHFGAQTGRRLGVVAGEHDIGVLTRHDYRRSRVLVGPAAPTIAHPTAGERLPGKTWRMLFLEVRTIDADFAIANGPPRHCKASLSQDRADLHFRFLEEAKDTVRELSGGLVLWELERRVLEAPIHFLEEGKFVGWESPSGPKLGLEPVMKIPDARSYDVVYALWPADGCITIDDIGTRPLCNANGGRFSTGYVVTADVSNVLEYWLCTSDVLIHEWLHTIEGWSATFGAPVPPFDSAEPWPLHAARKFGYPNASDRGWLGDFMMMRISGPPSAGSFGVGPDVLSHCTTLGITTPAGRAACRAGSRH